MSNELDPNSVEAQVNDAVQQALGALKMPVCDGQCEANQTLAQLHSQLGKAQQTANSAKSDLANAREQYSVALNGKTEFTAQRNSELKSSTKGAAKEEIGRLRAKLNDLDAPITAAASLEKLATRARSMSASTQKLFEAKESADDHAAEEALLDRQRATLAEAQRAEFLGAMNGWMRYAYFFVTAAFLIRFALTGAYRVEGNIMKLGVVLLLPFAMTYVSRLAQRYSPFGTALTSRLRYLYENGLQNSQVST